MNPQRKDQIEQLQTRVLQAYLEYVSAEENVKFKMIQSGIALWVLRDQFAVDEWWPWFEAWDHPGKPKRKPAERHMRFAKDHGAYEEHKKKERERAHGTYIRTKARTEPERPRPVLSVVPNDPDPEPDMDQQVQAIVSMIHQLDRRQLKMLRAILQEENLI